MVRFMKGTSINVVRDQQGFGHAKSEILKATELILSFAMFIIKS